MRRCGTVWRGRGENDGADFDGTTGGGADTSRAEAADCGAEGTGTEAGDFGGAVWAGGSGFGL